MMPRLVEIELPEVTHRMGVTNTRAFRFGPCSVFAGLEELAGSPRYHMSIAHPSRLPSWDEIKAAKRACEAEGIIAANRTYVMPFPPSTSWISLHAYCFHLWELLNDEIAAHWTEEASAAPWRTLR